MKALARVSVALLVVGLAGCHSQQPAPRPPTPADIVFLNGNVITMDDTVATAQAVAVAGQTIVAVGRNEDVAAWRGPSTTVVDLHGTTLVPGFIDAHQYRVQKHAAAEFANGAAATNEAVREGWTTLDELYVDQGVMAELTELDRTGRLQPRIDAYLPIMQYDEAGTSLGSWYQAYHQGQMLSPHVRVAGLIGFADYDNARVLLWTQDSLDDFLVTAGRQGWSVALKTVSTRSLEMILRAQQYANQVQPDLAARRNRLEHALFITPDQISRIKELGLVPVINLNSPGQLVGESDVDQLIAREPSGSYTPWRSLEQAGIRVANGTGWPSYYVDEPNGAPFGSPMHLIYQAVTRVGNLGRQPYPWLLDQTITAAEALRALTIDSAYATSEEAVKGSIAPGKLADLVELSGDPLTVETKQINDIRVLMTMIGGRVAWCAPGNEAACASRPAEATSPNARTSAAVDPFVGTWSAIDPADNSAMSLQVSRDGNEYRVVLTDTGARSCGVDAAGKPTTAATIDATGTVQGGALVTDVSTVSCLSDPPTTRQLSLRITYTYDAASDTIHDDAQNASWHRQA